ncbi:hypothetical protein L1049_024164 [Liquidambar formosana]|uniref:Uncharacterized protein n=1 Tax=Liquidambar formosana TaxID=63359 RepID=A0AAP0RUU7_LIQFO
MTSPNSQNPEEDLQTQNPNMTEDDDQQQQSPKSQSSKTLTLETETPDLQNPQQSDPDHHEDPQEEENPQIQEPEDPEGMSLSPPPPPPPITDTHITITIPDLPPENPPLITTPNVYRRGAKRKKPMTAKQRAALEKKLQTLTQNLKPIPFVPNKTLDFLTHEKLLKRLGLWDFVHVELDCNIRTDLLAQLIGTYNAQLRCCYVNECRISVSRADLARALKLPVKKDKINLGETTEDDLEIVSEEVAFVDHFVSNWVLLHEDTWIFPKEVLKWIMLIKEGHPEKVEWASLMWYMVEKEVVLGSQLVHCYYASHLQCLMKSQREDLFVEEPKVEVGVKEEEEDVIMEEPKVEVGVKEEEEDVIMEEPKVEVNVKEEEEEEDGVDAKLGESYDFRGHELEEPNIELSLGQDIVRKEQVTEEDVMNFRGM